MDSLKKALDPKYEKSARERILNEALKQFQEKVG
jgi:hypothetical protein